MEFWSLALNAASAPLIYAEIPAGRSLHVTSLAADGCPAAVSGLGLGDKPHTAVEAGRRASCGLGDFGTSQRPAPP